MSSPRPKRKVEELGEHMLSAAVGDVVSRTMSAAVGRYDAHATVDDQLDRLAMLLVMVHSAMDEAERVHAAGWWLRRWLWRLRDAALDGDEVLRSMRQQRLPEAGGGEATRSQGAGGRLWSAATRAARSARSLIMSAAGDDGGVDRLARTVARLEKICADLGFFLKLLELEIMRSLAPAQPSAPETRGGGGELVRSFISMVSSQPYSSLSESEPEHDLAYISQAEYVGCAVAIGLRIVAQKIQQATSNLRPPAPGSCDPLAPAPDTSRLRLRELVAVVREAVGLGDRAEVNAERRWLAEWRRELQGVADRADRVLLAGDDDEVRRTVRSLETAAVHLRAYVTLVRFAVVVVESC